MAPTRFPSTKADPAPLGQPLKFAFSGRTAKSTFLKAAMTERLSSWDRHTPENRGVPTAELVNLYRRWGDEGGYGVILTGNVMIDYDQLEAIGNAIVPPNAPFEGERFERFSQMAAAGKKAGSLMVAQVSHPGRQVGDHVNPNPISASDVQLEGEILGNTFAKPRAMEKEDFEKVIGGFAHTAEYLYKAGFDGIQLHGAHGYLFSQFLSPTTNRRTDKYGGSLENRARLIFEVLAAIRARVTDPSFVIGIKINSVEFQKDGISLDDPKELCRQLEAHGFDFVELSGGTYQQIGFVYHRESSKRREAFFLDFADAIVPEMKKTKTYVTGGLRTAGAMAEALKTVDGIGIGRPAAHEVGLPAKLISGEVESAINGLIDDQDFALSNVAAGAQMRLIGQDKEPLDLSREDQLKVFMQSLEMWQKETAADVDNELVGFANIFGIELQPYGTPYTM